MRDDRSMRFNPPPNWPPSPPGWTPPPGWAPDPAWGPPPPNWPLWVADAPKNRTPLIAGGVAAVLAIVAVIIGALYFTVWSKDSPAGSDEAQIRAVVAKFEAAWNDVNFDGFKPITCKDQQTKSDFNEADFKRAREDGPKLELTVESVKIKGDKATAVVKNRDTDKTQDIQVVREDGAWKVCDF
ncbi:MAG: hypothetical protein QOH57_3846 [Mycobacterium sp.]|jgi:hypothetical protein|nr:hypothetical protein [Mycobacterium sp.]